MGSELWCTRHPRFSILHVNLGLLDKTSGYNFVHSYISPPINCIPITLPVAFFGHRSLNGYYPDSINKRLSTNYEQDMNKDLQLNATALIRIAFAKLKICSLIGTHIQGKKANI